MPDSDSDSVLSTYTASEGDNLAMQEWPLAHDVAVRGMVLLVHGLGEHAGRYERLAQRLNAWGFVVRGYDQYGHGQSEGGRGALPTPLRLVDDLADLVESARRRIGPATPLVILGHSMGGLVAASLASRHAAPIDGLVLSSPALATWLSPVQKLLMAVVPKMAPDLKVGNGLDADFLSHDRAVVAAYRADPLVHDRISGRLARFVRDEPATVLAKAHAWRVPTLLMYAGADRLVNPAGSRAFAQAAPASVVTSRCFDDLYHEIFNEADAGPVFAQLKEWLDARF